MVGYQATRASLHPMPACNTAGSFTQQGSLQPRHLSMLLGQQGKVKGRWWRKAGRQADNAAWAAGLETGAASAARGSAGDEEEADAAAAASASGVCGRLPRPGRGVVAVATEASRPRSRRRAACREHSESCCAESPAMCCCC